MPVSGYLVSTPTTELVFTMDNGFSGGHPKWGNTYNWLSLSWLVVFWLTWIAGGAGGIFAREFRADAFIGRPFGAGVVQVPFREDPSGLTGAWGIQIKEEQGRILYPVVHVPRGLSVVEFGRRILESSSRPAAQMAASFLKDVTFIRVYFLFTGHGPLRLRVSSSHVYEAAVEARTDEREFRRCLREWWETLGEWDRPLMVGLPEESLLGEFMPYLECMLGHRLGLPRMSPREDTPEEWITWVRDSERVLSRPAVGSMLRSAWYDRRHYTPSLATVIVEDPGWEDRGNRQERKEELTPPARFFVEPMAFRVPAKCLYLRFGSYGNFVWFQDFLGRIGGDWQHLIRLQRWDHPISRQVEDSLGLERTLLARVMGPMVVEDVALLVGDPDFATGGTFGLLFKARNDALLSADLGRQRAQRLNRDPSLKEETLTIEGRQVSFLSSGDGRTHSYYVAEDGFHLISRSRRLVELFLRTKEGKGSLGQSPSFLKVREKIPADLGSTVFIYAGPEFWESFLGPRVRIELMRRYQALADIRLVQLALLASEAEGLCLQSIEALAEKGFLPPDFGPRADGSSCTLMGREVRDNLRGRPGTFPPVWDLMASSATPAEWAAYQAFRQRVAALGWAGQPVAISLRWQPGSDANDRRDRVDFQVWAASAGQVISLFGQSLGEPVKDRVVPLPEDVLAGELVGRNHRFFWGIRELRLPWDWDGNFRWGELLGLRDWLVGYWGEITVSGEQSPIGVSPGIGKEVPGGPERHETLRRILPRLRGALGRATGDSRISADRLGRWTAHTDIFRVSSFHQDVLLDVLSGFRLEPSPVPAQFRLHVADLSGRPIAAGISRLVYARAFGTTANHLRLFESLEQMFRLPPGKGRGVAEELLGGKLVCPLGGDYVWIEGPGGGWTSTRLAGGQRHRWMDDPPANFRAPPLDWFRGLELHLRSGDDGWVIVGTVGMELARNPIRVEDRREGPMK